MAVADPVQIACRFCGARPRQECYSAASGRPAKTHAIRWADAGLPDDVEPAPVDAVVIDFEAARRRKLARANGATFL